MRRQLERYGRWLIAIGVLMAIAAVCAGYILVNQRLSLPFRDTYTVKVEMATVPGLAPGLGQPANVAGVRVGMIKGVELRNGRAIVALEIERDKLPRVWDNAFATMVPNSPLKDLQMELFPGRPPAKELPDGGLVPIARTSPPIDSDELTNALDLDTRRFFNVLVAGSDEGLAGRGEDLRRLFASLGPTAEDLRTVSGALAERRRQLRRLVGNLAILTRRVGERDVELAKLVESGNATVTALAAEERALRASVRKLPATLRTTRRALDSARDFSAELEPAARALGPVAARAPGALKAAEPLVREAVPILRDRLRPLVRESQPLARDLAPATRSLSAVTPSLTTAFRGLNYIVNTLAHNPEGKDEGYLFWIAWFAHNGMSFISNEDANGAAWRGMLLFDCATLYAFDGIGPLLSQLGDLAPFCPK
ncbi:hypothetical protein GKE82_08795 [Conexibacter sp. W3-3-2]|uniref:MlaD family protein n=1 Tax=Conexibacter sp. W3-3-2 TaxID=2675227 RepID=UPI0012B9158C|nr:MlaD family protein [Conexibacter sp. W3-3-2]MTD44388.1 hypothetical protein [Conexibacter sp. W3-3-2]